MAKSSVSKLPIPPSRLEGMIGQAFFKVLMTMGERDYDGTIGQKLLVELNKAGFLLLPKEPTRG